MVTKGTKSIIKEGDNVPPSRQTATKAHNPFQISFHDEARCAAHQNPSPLLPSSPKPNPCENCTQEIIWGVPLRNGLLEPPPHVTHIRASESFFLSPDGSLYATEKVHRTQNSGHPNREREVGSLMLQRMPIPP